MVKSYNQGKFNIKILQSDSFRLVEFLSFVYNIPRLNKNTLNGYDPTYYKSNELKQSDQVL